MVDSESKHNVANDVDDEEVGLDSGVAVRIPRGSPASPQPSKEEKHRHDLTHINYQSWCHTVSLADATIHLTKLPNLVGATSLYFALCIALFAMWMTLTICLVLWEVVSIESHLCLRL